MITIDNILELGTNFRSKTLGDNKNYTQYNISPEFEENDTFLDFSSTTASQPSNNELDFFSSIYKKYNNLESIISENIKLKNDLANTFDVSENHIIFTPSGTDCDSILSQILGILEEFQLG